MSSTASVSSVLSFDMRLYTRSAYQTFESVRFVMLVLDLISNAELADSEVGCDDVEKSHATFIIPFKYLYYSLVETVCSCT